ncbi:MAG: hypothetical protein HC802_01290 [Caldilineaceae bacterium]|nr:hypothetical protein [Caldilineaceae bacterium]
MQKTTIRAGSNIAFIKYWGVKEASLNIPLSNSISMTLDAAYTLTTVEWSTDGALANDAITLDDQVLDGAAARRLVQHLDRIRSLAGVGLPSARGQPQQLSHGFRHRQFGQRIRRADCGRLPQPRPGPEANPAFRTGKARQRFGQSQPLWWLCRVGAGRR